jgi:histone H1/5
MVGKAISALKERGGSSRQAILKYIMANFNVGKDAKSVNAHLKLSQFENNPTTSAIFVYA